MLMTVEHSFSSVIRGYWHQQADERFGDPPPKVDPGAFSDHSQGWKTPRGPPGSALLLCV